MSIALMVKVDNLVKRMEALEKTLAGKVEQDAHVLGTDLESEFEARLADLEEHAKAVGAKLRIEF